jgi:hypothetical protein
MALLVNPTNPSIAEPFSRALQEAARALGLQLHVLHASSEREIEAAFATLVKLRAGGLVIMPDQLFLARSEQLATLTIRHAVPSVHLFREFAAAGGLMSYGSDEREYYRLVGIYIGRILAGEKPSDLPVQQVTKVAQEWTEEEITAGLKIFELTRHVPAGKQRTLDYFFFLNPDCTLPEGIDIAITKPPEYGSAVLETREGFPTYVKDNVRSKCNEKKMRVPVIIYKAPRNAGTDMLEARVIDGGGYVWLRRYTIKMVDR